MNKDSCAVKEDVVSIRVIFKSNYCQNPICLPSRASLITGKMPSSLGIYGNDGVLREKTTMATVFSAQGYEVAWLGKEHWGATNAEVGFGNLNDKAHEAFKEKYRPLNKLRKDFGMKLGFKIHLHFIFLTILNVKISCPVLFPN